MVNACTNRWAVAVASASLILGAVLSRVVDPGVRVEKIMLTQNTPAIRLFPVMPGPHPMALLAHGVLCSKEMMFRYGEALAAAGFDCYAVDQAGFGESPQPLSLTSLTLKLGELERTLGTVDVFIGHSMGGGLGAWAVREGSFHPKLFIGAGAVASLGDHGPPELWLAGEWDELMRPAQLQAGTNAQVVISPWSDHFLELFDPVLVGAAVKAACATVGRPVPAAPSTAWQWRLAGLVLGIAGALVLMFQLPGLHPRFTRMRGWMVPAVLIIAIMLTTGTWLGLGPQWRRLPMQLVLLMIIWLALAGLSRLRLPRWSLPVVTGILTLGAALGILGKPFSSGMFMMILGGCTLVFLPAVVVGRIADRGGSRRDGDIAMALFASYCIGQFMPFFY